MDDERPSGSSRFGRLLREYRLAAGLSQEALAERARMSSHGVSALERGYRRSPHRDTFALLTEALGLDDEQRAALENAAVRKHMVRRNGSVSENGAAPACSPPPPGLPLAWTSFVGREKELEEIRGLVREHRMVTVTGSGGVGKTQTALQVGNALAQESGATVCFVPLAPVEDQSFVVTATAAALGAAPAPGQPPLDAVLANLAGRELLLILDNCEHVVSEAARIAGSVLAKCADVRILTTSREPLRVAGEYTYRLPSLSQSASMALFVERATAVDHKFALDAEAASAVSELCTHLDGIPLAIELAAARVRLLSVKAINERLADRFLILTGGERTALPRQQTMRAAIDWSYDLLSEPERKLFERFSVFAGACTLAAVLSLYTTERMTEDDLLEVLSSLVDKSLVVADLLRGEPRYRLLESSRQYAREKLALRGEEGIIARRHAEAYLAQAERSARTAESLGRPELDNLRAALRWALSERNDFLLGQRLAACLPMGMLPSEGRQWVRAALDSVDARTPIQVVAALKHRVTNAAFFLREYKTVVAEYGEVVRLYREAGNERDVALVQDMAGHALVSLGRVAEAKKLIEEALTTARRLNDRRLIAWTSRCLAHASAKAGDFAAARSSLLEVLPIYETDFSNVDLAYTINDLGRCEFASGNAELALEYAKKMLAIALDVSETTSMAAALNSIAVYLIALGRYDEAEGHARKTLELSSKHHLDAFAAYALQHLATLAVLRAPSNGEEGRCVRQRAARVFGFVDARLASIGSTQMMTQEQEYNRVIALLREAIGAGDLTELMAAGALMTQERASAEALSS